MVAFKSFIYHAEDSKAEGLPARIRVITPSYVYFVDTGPISSQNTYESNYTIKSVSADKVRIIFNLYSRVSHECYKGPKKHTGPTI